MFRRKKKSVTFFDLAAQYRPKKRKIPPCCQVEFRLALWFGFYRHHITCGCYPKCPHMHCWFHRRKLHPKP